MKAATILLLAVATILLPAPGPPPAAADSAGRVAGRRGQVAGGPDRAAGQGESATIPAAPAAGPVDAALGALGLDRSSITTPRSEESDYNLVWRMPVIDRLMANPFELPGFWGGLGERLRAEGPSAVGTFWVMRDVMSDGVTRNRGWEIAQARQTSPEAVPGPGWRGRLGRELAEGIEGVTEEAARDAWKIEDPGPALVGLVRSLIRPLREATGYARGVRAGLLPEDVERIGAARKRFFFDGEEYRFLTVSVEQMRGLRGDVEPFRRAGLVFTFWSAEALAWWAEQSRAQARAAAGEVRARGIAAPVLFDLETAHGRIVIGGTGDNRYDEPPEWIVDLGGDDCYGEGVASTEGAEGALSMVLDISGDDRYESPETPGPAFATLGAALLWDCAGDDLYLSGWHGQGSAFGGVAILVDEAGDDDYRARFFAQGAGVFGAGLLLDLAGDDRYVADGFAQGFGSTMGAGLLRDLGGNDLYSCGMGKPEGAGIEWGNGQGAALGVRSYPWMKELSLYGGLGFLVDEEGHDLYEGRTFTQGASYFLSLGALLDRSGNDRYIGLGEHHHGGGIHLCASILTDLAGNDLYEGENSAQAAACDRSVGWLVDHEGDDSYRSRTGNSQAYSRKSNSLSVLADLAGDDRYECPTTGDERGQGYAQLTSAPWGQSVILFLDSGGKDTYSEEGRGDGLTWVPQPGVYGTDTEAPPDPLFAYAVPAPSGTGAKPDGLFRHAPDPAPPDPEGFRAWVRRQLPGRGADMEEIGEAEPSSRPGGERPSRRGEGNRGGAAGPRRPFHPIEEVLRLAVEEKLGEEHYRALAAWLEHPDPLYRLHAAKLLGRSGVAVVARPLRAAAEREKDPYARKLLLEAIGRLGVWRERRALLRAAREDASAECRRYALVALEELQRKAGRKDAAPFLGALGDPSPDIRFTAAKMLVRVRDPAAVPALLARASDPDVWVRRSVAQALLACGEKRGIPVMIGTMDFYSLDNSYYNYGQDIGNVLKQYTNVGFLAPDAKGGERRDDLNAEKWIAWWKENGAGFDIGPFLAPARLVDEADLLRRENRMEEARGRYREALALVPGFRLAEERMREIEE